jgi:hypothetical protein
MNDASLLLLMMMMMMTMTMMHRAHFYPDFWHAMVVVVVDFYHSFH